MLLGILSDTHDQYDRMGRAVRTLKERGAEFFIHCGDVCQPRLLDHLAGLPSAFVWGNCDWDRMALQRYGDNLSVPCYGAFADLELAGKKIALTHGDDRIRMAHVLNAKEHDYLLHGHTHVRRDERIDNLRIINPGALHRAAEKTVALLNTDNDRLEFLTIA
jgi:putative phosphoesterase